MNRLRPALLLLAAAVAAAPASAAPRVSEPGAAARLAAGTPAVALFDLTGASLEGTDEMELVLSLDGGRTFPWCVSRDLPPGTSRALWTVPDVSASSAVLGVRTGGRGEAERVVAVSAPFEIVRPAPEAPAPPGGALAPRDSELGAFAGAAGDVSQRSAAPLSPEAPAGAAPIPDVAPAREPRYPASRGAVFLPRRE
jgi:hypothetical protein